MVGRIPVLAGGRVRFPVWHYVGNGVGIRERIVMGEELGECDCGYQYLIGSRVDHDADTGQCWECSYRHRDEMTDEEWDVYVNG